MIYGTDDFQLRLSRVSNTIDDYRKQGRFAGRAYGEWYWQTIREREDRGETVDFKVDVLDFLNVYLPKLNAKMIPVFHPTREQLDAFNLAMTAGFSEYASIMTVGGFDEALSLFLLMPEVGKKALLGSVAAPRPPVPPHVYRMARPIAA
jgi:hypothetical protein